MKSPQMHPDSKIFVAGHRGLVGSALMRQLQADGYENLITRSSRELDLRNQAQVEAFFDEERPEFVFLAAAKVGGIGANSAFPAEFIYNNLSIETNIIHFSYRFHVKKLLFLGSSCIYPKFAPQPLKEESLLTGLLEPTNEPYAIAKIAGIKLCQAYNRQYGTRYISVMPTNLFGPQDNFDLETSHVLPAMIRKFHEAKQTGGPVLLWGTGKARREFMYVDDLADACLFLMKHYEKQEPINVGTGKDLTIHELSQVIQETLQAHTPIVWDPSRPDGTPQKLLDVSKIHSLGWKSKTDLHEGIAKTYSWYQTHPGQEILCLK